MELKDQSLRLEVVEAPLFAGAVADEIILSLNETIDDQGKAVVAMAGGSTPAATYRLLGASPRREQVKWNLVDCILGDERLVELESQHSNYRMINETFVHQFTDVECAPRLHPLSAIQNPAQAINEYTALLNQLTAGTSVIDLMLLGIGEDGHTASLFPGKDWGNLKGAESQAFFVASQGGEPKTQRLSSSPKLIASAKQIIVLATGAKKAQVLKEILNGKSDYPASLILAAKGRVRWFLDQEAAKLL